jgi:glycosyltransferase involved in cell wall biosynthesis
VPGKNSSTKTPNRHTVRLLHVVGDLKFGGRAQIIGRLAEMAQEMGWHVDVLATDPVCRRMFREHRIGVVDLDVVRRAMNPWRDLKGVFQLWQFLRRNHYDIVHTHDSKAGLVGRLAAKFAGVTGIIHTVHILVFDEESSRWARWAYVRLERIAGSACNRIVMVCDHHRRWALKLGIATEGKLIAIPNGIAASQVQPNRNGESIRQSLGIAPNTHMLLTTSRLAERKGLEHLIAAAQLIKSRGEMSFKLVFAGAGPFARHLEKLVDELGLRKEVAFLGFRSDVGNLLAAADIVVLPGLREGLSIALLEAMAASKPIVTNTIGSNQEATGSGQGALLVPANNPEALAQAIGRFAIKPAVGIAKSAKANEIFRRCYTENRMFDAYRAQYLELLQPAGGRVDSKPRVANLRSEYGREGSL